MSVVLVSSDKGRVGAFAKQYGGEAAVSLVACLIEFEEREPGIPGFLCINHLQLRRLTGKHLNVNPAGLR